MFTTFTNEGAGQQAHLSMSRMVGMITQSLQVDIEAMACWEDRLDMLGSEPDLVQLRALLDEAPCTDSDLYDFAKNHYLERLPAEMQDWEDKLDAMGVWSDLQELELMLATCPDPDHPTALFLTGVITQRVLAC